jgi:rare lipoprotein A (peptidoglycan hydrolase)
MDSVSYDISSQPYSELQSENLPFEAAQPVNALAFSVAKNSRAVLGGIVALGITALVCATSAARETPGPLVSASPPHSVLEYAVFTQIGKGSWYGRWHNGRKTASGERFNMYQMTAAHRTLPLGTIVRVTNPANGKTVKVKINDRGPYIAGRVIDLSAAAAAALGISRKGTARLRIETYASDQMPG